LLNSHPNLTIETLAQYKSGGIVSPNLPSLTKLDINQHRILHKKTSWKLVEDVHVVYIVYNIY